MMENKQCLVFVDKLENLENRLRKRREKNVFPLTPTHRKELRNLRDTSIGSLNERLLVIKESKFKEFKDKHYDEILVEMNLLIADCDEINIDWKERIKKINDILKERQEYEKELKIVNINIEADYGYRDISKVNEFNTTRNFYVKHNDYINNIASRKFNEIYNAGFKEVRNLIDDMNTKYEEAINFGDLEIVKELYFILKDGDKFLEKLINLEVV